jgi:hypothetical protein
MMIPASSLSAGGLIRVRPGQSESGGAACDPSLPARPGPIRVRVSRDDSSRTAGSGNESRSAPDPGLPILPCAGLAMMAAAKGRRTTTTRGHRAGAGAGAPGVSARPHAVSPESCGFRVTFCAGAPEARWRASARWQAPRGQKR